MPRLREMMQERGTQLTDDEFKVFEGMIADYKDEDDNVNYRGKGLFS